MDALTSECKAFFFLILAVIYLSSDDFLCEINVTLDLCPLVDLVSFNMRHAMFVKIIMVTPPNMFTNKNDEV